MARSAFDRFSFGGRIPPGLGLVLVLTIATSLAVAFGERHAASLFELTPLVPSLVMRGQVWRIVTWVLIEPEPISLLFRCLLLYWLGRDLAGLWGSRRFLTVYFGTCVVSAVVTCLVAIVDPAIRQQSYLGSWALDAAVTVAWGLHFPDRVIRIYFVIPVRGKVIAWGTVGLCVAYAIVRGWERYLPVLIAQGAMLSYVYRGRLRTRWLKFRLAMLERERARERSRRRAASRATLRLIESKDDLAPLTSEEEAAIARAIGRVEKKPSREHLN